MMASADRARYPDLAGATVFVSGGGSGIGAAFVRLFAAQGCRVAFIDIADAPSQALARRARRLRALLALRRARHRGAAARDRRRARRLWSDTRADQQRRARRPPPDGGRDARVLGRESRRQPAPSSLRHAGGRAADGRGRRRLDHQSRLHLVDARPAGDGLLHDVESSDLRHDARARARARRAQHSRQRARPRRDSYSAPGGAVGLRPIPCRSSSTSNASNFGFRGRRRARGVVPRLRRGARHHRREPHRRRRSRADQRRM